MTTVEGGMVTTNDSQFAMVVRRLRDHGAATTDLQRHQGAKPYLLPEFPEAGLNQRMTDIQGALGSAQMNRADEIVAQRQALARRYDEAFEGLNWLRTPAHIEGFGHGYQSYACLFRPHESETAAEMRDTRKVSELRSERNAWMERLHHNGISTRPATHAVHMLEYYTTKYNLVPEEFPGAFLANDCSISLPLFHGMKPEEQDRVISEVNRASF